MNAILDQLGIARMTIEQRLELIGAIWDTLPESDTVPVPEWHLRELERRLAAEPGVEAPWEAVKARLQGNS